MRPAIKITLAVSSLMKLAPVDQKLRRTVTDHTSCDSASHRVRDAFRGAKHLGTSLVSSQEANRYQQAGYPVQDDESE